MQPGDQVILTYEEYSQLKNAYKDYPALVEETKELKKLNEELAHKLQVTQQKLILKNGLVCKQQFKSEYLMSLFDDLNTAFGIKDEAIGKDMKFLRNMDETYFSVIQLPGQVDQDQRLPENFSKSNTYIEVDTELHAYRNLAEVCTKQWIQKQKVIEYLEQSLKTSQGKDTKKIQEQAEKMQKQLKAQVNKLTVIIVDLEADVRRITDEKNNLQDQNGRAVSMVESLQSIIGTLRCQTQNLSKQNMRLIQNLNDLSETVKQQQAKISSMTENLKSQNLQVETHLKEQIKCLNEDKNLLKQKLAELKDKEDKSQAMIKMMEQKEQRSIDKFFELENRVSQFLQKEKSLKNELVALQIETEEQRRFAQISTEMIDRLKNEVEKLEKEILHLRTSTTSENRQANSSEHVTDIKSKLFSLIGEYIIYLNKQMMEIELTVAEKKTIIRSEVLQVQEQFGKELKKLKL